MNEFHTKKMKAKRQRRARAHFRIRARLRGTTERPRLAVFKSLRFTYAQVIDDTKGVTLAQASSREPELQEGLEGSPSSCDAARKVGEKLAERAKTQGVETVVFDRGGFAYHGRIKAVAESARSHGLDF